METNINSSEALLIQPEHPDYIFDGEFAENPDLIDIIIPNGIKRIEKWAFDRCDELKSVFIPESVASIGETAFFYCDSLVSITIAQNNPVYHSANNCVIETASKKLVLGCKSSAIPDDGSVTSIGENAFYGCDIENITIPACVTSIGESAFSFCRELKSVNLPDGITSICDGTFINCGSLTSITIPDSVTSIGRQAFEGCSGLTSISIPNGVTSIGDYAVDRCSGLTSITVAQGNPVYHSANNCLIETAAKKLILGCKDCFIPTDGSVTSIAHSAFAECKGPKELFIPNEIKTIGAAAFSLCQGIQTIYCEAESKPEGWDDKWNINCNAEVIWGCNGNTEN